MKTPIVIFVTVSLFDLVSAGPICRQCLDAANITECITRTVECWDNETPQDTCLVCDGVHSDVTSCNTAATCAWYEACFTGIRIVGSSIRHVFGCIDERVCRAMVDNNNKNSTVNHNGRRVIHGDQGTPICDACCKGDLCNTKECFDLKQSMGSVFGPVLG
ncbi:uncharacterized protein LOC111099843 [Crassostrea virginica]